jgi:hypothetical protein
VLEKLLEVLASDRSLRKGGRTMAAMMVGRRRLARGRKRATPFYSRDGRVGEGSAFAAKGCLTIYTAVRWRASTGVRAKGGTADGSVVHGGRPTDEGEHDTWQGRTSVRLGARVA